MKCNLLGGSFLSWQHNTSDCGAALVEFALVLPMVLLLATGIFSFGFALNNYLELTNAVNLAAQQVGISRSQTTDPCALAAQTIDNAAPMLNAANLSLTTTIFTGDPSAPVSNAFPGVSCSSASTTTGAAGDLTQGNPVEVSASYPCVLAGYGFNFPCHLEARVTEIVQ